MTKTKVNHTISTPAKKQPALSSLTPDQLLEVLLQLSDDSLCRLAQVFEVEAELAEGGAA